MGRGSKVFYVNGLTDIDTQATLNSEINAAIGEEAKYGDIAIEKDSNSSLDPSAPTLYRRKSNIFQFDGTNWTKILQRENSDLSADTKAAFNQQDIVGNVTYIKRSDMEDMRSYLGFIQQLYARRYGDAWFNDHDWSRAVMKWSDGNGNSTGRIFIGNYGPSDDSKYLTLEFGQTDFARMKFIHRAASTSYIDILELRKGLVHSFVDAQFDGQLTVSGDGHFSEDLFVEQKMTAGYLINRGAYFYLSPTGGLDEDSGTPSNGRALASAAGNKLVVNYSKDFSGGVEIDGVLSNKPADTEYRVWTEEYDGDGASNPDNKGINACMLHGIHPGNSSGNIPINNGTVNEDLNAEKINGITFRDNNGSLEWSSDGATWIPVFKPSVNMITPVEVDDHSGSSEYLHHRDEAEEVWVTYNASAFLPSDARYIIVHSHVSLNNPNDGIPRGIMFRKESGSNEYEGVQAGAYGDGDTVHVGGQSIVELSSNKTFDYKVNRYFHYWGLKIVGYYI